MARKKQSDTYPGGKSGSGVYQRLINLIPPHRVLIVPFAGHCGVTRKIRPAEHTIVIDRDPTVCEWWHSWSRSKNGRCLEIHNCDGIEWLWYRAGCSEYSAPAASDSGSNGSRSTIPGDSSKRRVMEDEIAAPAEGKCDTAANSVRASQDLPSEAFVFCDPPYVLSERATGKIYQFEMSDSDHLRLLSTLTRLDASRYRAMLCGYRSDLYSPLNDWKSIDHRVMTRGGLQDECIWLNFDFPLLLHDYSFIGDDRRARERIRRRQKNWLSQLSKMPKHERQAIAGKLVELLENESMLNCR